MKYSDAYILQNIEEIENQLNSQIEKYKSRGDTKGIELSFRLRSELNLIQIRYLELKLEELEVV